MSDRPRETSPRPPQTLIGVLRGSRTPLLVGHERPDGDCLGSQAGLARILMGLGRSVRILNPDPAESHLAFLMEGLEVSVHQGGPVPEHDVCVLLDGSELSRCGPLGDELARHASTKLVIDHHLHAGAAWWDDAYLDSAAAATGLLVWRLAREMQVTLDARAADALLTSLVTDTGWFRFPSTDAETLHAAAELVELGADPAGLVRRLDGGRAPEHPFALAAMLETTEYLADGRLATLTGADRPDASADAGAGDEALGVVRRVAGVEVVLYFRVVSPGRVKLSARSEGEFDVCSLAARFGGGGHRRAAGATIEGALSEVRALVTSAAILDLGVEASRPSDDGGRV